ncbi:MAG TPA: branched-chain amino acid ABC transporter permease [Geminicoccaceae bacterium]
MDAVYLLTQLLNGLQFGFMLFLMAAGLTLVFGIMNLLNLAHGSFYMVGAFLAAAAQGWTGSFVLGVLIALPLTVLVGIAVEVIVFRRLYARDHLDQVLATFGLILFFNELVRIVFGPQPLYMALPDALGGQVEILPGVPYPTFRLAITGVGIAVAVGLAWLIRRTRLGMLIRAGASNRTMVQVMGVDIALLYTLIFGLGAALAGLAGMMAGPILAVEVGMGETVLILTFVVVVIGGLGSIRGALVAALLVGVVDTFARTLLPFLLYAIMSPQAVASLAPALSSVMIYVLMALVLIVRPQGLLPAHA